MHRALAANHISQLFSARVKEISFALCPTLPFFAKVASSISNDSYLSLFSRVAA